MVMERMNHIQKWEDQKGHEYEWGPGEEEITRDHRTEIDLVCRYENCGRVFRNKGALTIHQKRMHRAAAERKRFACDLCGKAVETMVAKVNHEKTCNGGREMEDGRRECDVCNGRIARANYARHVKRCRGEGLRREDEEVRRGRREQCRYCGRLISYSNMARHERTCLMWDPGGGPNPI